MAVMTMKYGFFLKARRHSLHRLTIRLRPYIEMRMVMMPKKGGAGAYPVDLSGQHNLHLCRGRLQLLYEAFNSGLQ
jgi:hypothetical protein